MNDVPNPYDLALAKLRAASAQQTTPEEQLAAFEKQHAAERTAEFAADAARAVDDARRVDGETAEFRAAALTDLAAYESPDVYGLKEHK